RTLSLHGLLVPLWQWVLIAGCERLRDEKPYVIHSVGANCSRACHGGEAGLTLGQFT
ncbi:uncharacterized protein DAT39_019717, partial [Clarias magur]